MSILETHKNTIHKLLEQDFNKYIFNPFCTCTRGPCRQHLDSKSSLCMRPSNVYPSLCLDQNSNQEKKRTSLLKSHLCIHVLRFYKKSSLLLKHVVNQCQLVVLRALCYCTFHVLFQVWQLSCCVRYFHLHFCHHWKTQTHASNLKWSILTCGDIWRCLNLQSFVMIWMWSVQFLHPRVRVIFKISTVNGCKIYWHYLGGSVFSSNAFTTQLIPNKTPSLFQLNSFKNLLSTTSFVESPVVHVHVELISGDSYPSLFCSPSICQKMG